MLEADIIAGIQRGCRNPRLSTSDISAVIVRGVTYLGTYIKQADPSLFHRRISVGSLTNVFQKPSDCTRIEKVWDLGSTAFEVTGASDVAGVVRLTVVDHNFLTPDGFDYIFDFVFGEESGDIVTVHDVGGVPGANGTFKVVYVDADTIELQGSSFSGLYTSGGRIFRSPSAPTEFKRKILSDATLADSYGWYPRGDTIVIDDQSFANDIMLDYIKAPTVYTDIPSQYHEGLISFAVVALIKIPPPEDPQYQDFVTSISFNRENLKMIVAEIQRDFKTSSEPQYIRNVWGER